MIKEYLENFDLDVRKSGDARFMDQKCTPDVVCIIADCIINLRESEPNKEFTVQDIWDSQYFIKNVKAIFNKPSATNPTTKSEYDKFIQQPLRLLAYAHVLHIEKKGNRNFYKISNLSVLEYISLKDKNAYNFLYQYFVKVLSDSGLIKFFETYKTKCEQKNLTQTDFEDLQNRFIKFIIGNTAINGEVEIRRIYPKILNVFACENNLPGSVKGRMSTSQFYYTDLMYNRKNWRDLSKDKTISRQEALNISEQTIVQGTEFNAYLVQKAMNQIRKMYTESEVKDYWSNGEATQIHHIFSKSKFPQLAHYLENLIKLTATQHYTKAHPSNKTDSTNSDYQLVCLLAKADNIERSLEKNELYYRKESFIYCINTGLSKTLNLDLNFRQIKTELAHIYNDN
ncbi:hypothetical protein IWX84_003118 [Flavobacterium sp. CG_9.10]|uniref:hypothetical protein n=1 Tax=Flavobacterium sp. CG_9.10 TaxID=2787729 RepID=UPI0018CA6C58|nr:hypothetical protein [Flavobacterium sp. CG_9.10]MBG6112215.1 hypothetical protein [Flavobacterium sp. CG_9.10]